MFTLAISHLTTSKLPWFMDLTFRIPMQYSLQNQTLLPLPVTSTTQCYFHFGSASSFFLELFLHSSAVAYQAPNNLGSSPFRVISFCLFTLFMGFSRQESEKAMATHSSTLAWKIPWTEEPGRLQPMGLWRVGHDWSDLATAAARQEYRSGCHSLLQWTMVCQNSPL